MMFGQVIIPNAVHREVVERGIESKHPDAFITKKLEDEGYIQVIAVTNTKLIEEINEGK